MGLSISPLSRLLEQHITARQEHETDTHGYLDTASCMFGLKRRTRQRMIFIMIDWPEARVEEGLYMCLSV